MKAVSKKKKKIKISKGKNGFRCLFCGKFFEKLFEVNFHIKYGEGYEG